MGTRLTALPLITLIVMTALVSGCSPGEQSVSEEGAAAEVSEKAYLDRAQGGSTEMPRGEADPDISVDIYDRDRTHKGTTIFSDVHDPGNPRIVEVNMLGEVVWEYRIPEELKGHSNPGFDVEVLDNDNVLFVLPGYGTFEIDRAGGIVWSHLDRKISHDADRLPNGNTIYVFGGRDGLDDAQVKEVNPQGEVVWEWYARDDFYTEQYNDIYDEGWTHANAVTRLPGGNTLISLRNFDLVAEVDAEGNLVEKIGEGVFHSVHDPEVTPAGNILAISQEPPPPNHALELDPDTGEVVWEFGGTDWGRLLARDADRLPNGNTMLTGTNEIIEVTPEGEIVWRMKLAGEGLVGPGSHTRGLYKAERVGLVKD